MDVPAKYQDLVDKARKNSRKAAIRAFCLSCVGWSAHEVAQCTSVDCPLFKYRKTG